MEWHSTRCAGGFVGLHDRQARCCMAGFAASGHLGKWCMDRNVGHHDATGFRRLDCGCVFPGRTDRNRGWGSMFRTLPHYFCTLCSSGATDGVWRKLPGLPGPGSTRDCGLQPAGQACCFPHGGPDGAVRLRSWTARPWPTGAALAEAACGTRRDTAPRRPVTDARGRRQFANFITILSVLLALYLFSRRHGDPRFTGCSRQGTQRQPGPGLFSLPTWLPFA